MAGGPDVEAGACSSALGGHLGCASVCACLCYASDLIHHPHVLLQDSLKVPTSRGRLNGKEECLGLLPKQGIRIPEERLSLNQGSLPLNPFTLHLRLLLGGHPYMDVSILTQWEGPFSPGEWWEPYGWYRCV